MPVVSRSADDTSSSPDLESSDPSRSLSTEFASADSVDVEHPSRKRYGLLSRTFSALEEPNYRMFYMGQGISLIGTWLQHAAVAWVVFDQTKSTVNLGYIEMASLMPGVVMGLFAGSAADRFRPRTVIMCAMIIQMLLALTLFALVTGGVVRFWHMIAVLALARVCVTFEMPSRQILVHALVGRAALTNAIALNTGLFNASRTIGPALAGVILAYLAPSTCFALNALSFIAAIVALASIQIPSSRREPSPSTPDAVRAGQTVGPVPDRVAEPAPRQPSLASGSVLGGFAYLLCDRRVAAAYAVMSFFGVVAMGYVSQIPAYTQLVFGAGPQSYGLLQASNGIGATLGALLVASMAGSRCRDRMILGGMALFGLFMLGAATIPLVVMRLGPQWLALAIAAILLVGVGLGAIMFYSSTQILIQMLVPDHLRGRIMGIWMIVFSSSVPLGAFWVGRVIPAIAPEDPAMGLSIVMVVSGTICILAAGIFLATNVLGERPTSQGMVQSS